MRDWIIKKLAPEIIEKCDHLEKVLEKEREEYKFDKERSMQNYNEVIYKAGNKSQNALKTLVVTSCYKFREIFGKEKWNELKAFIAGI